LTERERIEKEARQVTAWMHDMKPMDRPHPLVVVRARNGNDTPIYGVTVQTHTGIRGIFVRWLGTMGPGETREFTILLPAPPHMSEVKPSVMFTDSQGRQWIREYTGIIKEPTV